MNSIVSDSSIHRGHVYVLRPMTHYPETGTKNQYQKTHTGFLHGVEQCSNPLQLSVPEKSVSSCMTHLQETGTGFVVTVFGTSFWSLCHGHYACHIV